MMTPDEMIAVIQAHKEGQIIQYKDKHGTQWNSAVPTFSFDMYDYRVKPKPKKPREWWVNNWALDQYAGKATDYDTIHVREVLSEP